MAVFLVGAVFDRESLYQPGPCPVVPVGVVIGWWLVKVVPIENFYRIIYILLFVAGGKLIWDGLVGGAYI